MKLGTLDDGSRDGTLVVVSADAQRWLFADGVAPTLQAALDDWAQCEPQLRALSQRLADGAGRSIAHPIAGRRFAAPLPRAWQWLDASVYRSHSELLDRLFGRESVPSERPLMYQGMSHRFLGPTDDVPLPRESDDIDFEGEFAIICDAVPMGVDASEAIAHIKLVTIVNDWSLRAYASSEKKTGFGWILAKPACSMAPFAVTPDELGPAWRDARVHLDLEIHWNGRRFGHANGGAMAHGFDELVAHAASTRDLCAGTIIGSGTVSNDNYREVGSSCIAERRAIEMLDDGQAKTPFMRFGDSVRLEARSPQGASVFGAIEQRVVDAGRHAR